MASITCIDPKITGLVKRGLDSFSSLIAHRLLRWQIRTGFENWLQKKEDPRLISTIGGYKGIANLIGCFSSHKAITIVKSLLFAQAYARFSFIDGSCGNMIALRESKHNRKGEPYKIDVILGDLLLPNYTHLLPKGEKRRLIPVPDLPSLIGSNNTHAAQAFLQLLLLEEFSDQSQIFFKKGGIYLPEDKWSDLADEAKLPKSILERVIVGWIDQKFLNRTKDNLYTIGEGYPQMIEFLRYQGKQREAGKKAAIRNITKKRDESPNFSLRLPRLLPGSSPNS